MLEESCASVRQVASSQCLFHLPSNCLAQICSQNPSTKCTVQFRSQLCQVQSRFVSPFHLSQPCGLVTSPKKFPINHSELELPAACLGREPGKLTTISFR